LQGGLEGVYRVFSRDEVFAVLVDGRGPGEGHAYPELEDAGLCHRHRAALS
jgi:hypothetical protein